MEAHRRHRPSPTHALVSASDVNSLSGATPYITALSSPHISPTINPSTSAGKTIVEAHRRHRPSPTHALVSASDVNSLSGATPYITALSSPHISPTINPSTSAGKTIVEAHRRHRPSPTHALVSASDVNSLSGATPYITALSSPHISPTINPSTSAGKTIVEAHRRHRPSPTHALVSASDVNSLSGATPYITALSSPHISPTINPSTSAGKTIVEAHRRHRPSPTHALVSASDVNSLSGATPYITALSSPHISPTINPSTSAGKTIVEAHRRHRPSPTHALVSASDVNSLSGATPYITALSSPHISPTINPSTSAGKTIVEAHRRHRPSPTHALVSASDVNSLSGATPYITALSSPHISPTINPSTSAGKTIVEAHRRHRPSPTHALVSASDVNSLSGATPYITALSSPHISPTINPSTSAGKTIVEAHRRHRPSPTHALVSASDVNSLSGATPYITALSSPHISPTINPSTSAGKTIVEAHRRHRPSPTHALVSASDVNSLSGATPYITALSSPHISPTINPSTSAGKTIVEAHRRHRPSPTHALVSASDVNSLSGATPYITALSSPHISPTINPSTSAGKTIVEAHRRHRPSPTHALVSASDVNSLSGATPYITALSSPHISPTINPSTSAGKTIVEAHRRHRPSPTHALVSASDVNSLSGATPYITALSSPHISPTINPSTSAGKTIVEAHRRHRPSPTHALVSASDVNSLSGATPYITALSSPHISPTINPSTSAGKTIVEAHRRHRPSPTHALVSASDVNSLSGATPYITALSSPHISPTINPSTSAGKTIVEAHRRHRPSPTHALVSASDVNSLSGATPYITALSSPHISPTINPSTSAGKTIVEAHRRHRPSPTHALVSASDVNSLSGATPYITALSSPHISPTINPSTSAGKTIVEAHRRHRPSPTHALVSASDVNSLSGATPYITALSSPHISPTINPSTSAGKTIVEAHRRHRPSPTHALVSASDVNSLSGATPYITALSSPHISPTINPSTSAGKTIVEAHRRHRPSPTHALVSASDVNSLSGATPYITALSSPHISPTINPSTSAGKTIVEAHRRHRPSPTHALVSASDVNSLSGATPYITALSSPHISPTINPSTSAGKTIVEAHRRHRPSPTHALVSASDVNSLSGATPYITALSSPHISPTINPSTSAGKTIVEAHRRHRPSPTHALVSASDVNSLSGATPYITALSSPHISPTINPSTSAGKTIVEAHRRHRPSPTHALVSASDVNSLSGATPYITALSSPHISPTINPSTSAGKTIVEAHRRHRPSPTHALVSASDVNSLSGATPYITALSSPHISPTINPSTSAGKTIVEAHRRHRPSPTHALVSASDVNSLSGATPYITALSSPHISPTINPSTSAGKTIVEAHRRHRPSPTHTLVSAPHINSRCYSAPKVHVHIRVSPSHIHRSQPASFACSLSHCIPLRQYLAIDPVRRSQAWTPSLYVGVSACCSRRPGLLS